MIRTEICPFDDPEYLSKIADDVNKQLSTTRNELTAQILPLLNEEQRRIFNELDNLGLNEIIAVQSATVKKTICEPCRRRGTPCRNPEK